MLANKCNLKNLYATIEMDNISSIKAHKKIGFRLLSERRLNELRKIGLLGKKEYRFVKNY